MADGDYAAFSEEAFALQNDLLCGKSMDDRACFSAPVGAGGAEGPELDVDLIILAVLKKRSEATAPEPGLLPIARLPPFAIDVCHAKTADSKPATRVSDLGGAGDSPWLRTGFPSTSPRRADGIAGQRIIPYQIEAIPATGGTNAWAIQTEEAACVRRWFRCR